MNTHDGEGWDICPPSPHFCRYYVPGVLLYCDDSRTGLFIEGIYCTILQCSNKC